jgi:hypothetical protein
MDEREYRRIARSGTSSSWEKKRVRRIRMLTQPEDSGKSLLCDDASKWSNSVIGALAYPKLLQATLRA